MEANRNQTGCLKTTLILIGAAIVFLVAIVLIGDFKCAYDVEDWWMPLYPNGETINIEYDFLRPRAWGTTIWSMASTDDVETVKQFYRDTRIATLKTKTRGLAWGESRVQPLDDAIASAQARYESISQELESAKAKKLAAEKEKALETEKEKALDWLNKLEQALETGARSVVSLFSICGI